MAGERYKHILLPDPPDTLKFTTPPSGGGGGKATFKPREPHSQFLRRKLNEAWAAADDEQAVAHISRDGVYLEFISDPDAELIVKSLEDLRYKNKIRLCNVRTEIVDVVDEDTGDEKKVKTTYATVYIPKDKKNHFIDKVEEYANPDLDSDKGKAKNVDLLNSIASIRKALLIDSFWTDSRDQIPEEEPEWCEVWLRSSEDRVIQRFEALIHEKHIDSKEGVIKFPERSVKVILVNKSQLAEIARLSDDIAEYRRAKETSAFWMDMEKEEESEWVIELLDRLRINPNTNVSVCILDTGVNRGHPLLEPVLEDADCQSVDPSWGPYDHFRHGTLMAGIVAYGNLTDSLSSAQQIIINHKLESVKILFKSPLKNDPDLWGDITSQGISLAEVQAPDRQRVICLAVSASDTRDRGRPSSWSGAIDNITSGADEDDKPRRLIIIAAGNVFSDDNIDSKIEEIILPYPDSQLTKSVKDPAQAWNAVTVGAYTCLSDITNPTAAGYSSIAPAGGLSPFSSTSLTWEDKWPIKPEIVMEGGNAAFDGTLISEFDELSLLSTWWKPTDKLFWPHNMTSAATAEASRLAARIMYMYPELWPETIRGLLIHSAEWTDTLKAQFLPHAGKPAKSDYYKLLRTCGYGVPNYEKSISSASNTLTLISQANIQPYEKESGKIKTKDMHFYELPWPIEVLRGLEDTDVKMKITLSYFIEPGPCEVGWKDRYKYSSHGLRFEINSPTETKEQFLKRINKAIRDEDEGHPGTSSASEYWKIGQQGRDRGSIHSDIWEGTARDLADSNLIAIFPVMGWWRNRSHLKQYNNQARYSLIVSIHTPEEDIDIYTPVATQVGIMVPIPIKFE